MDGIISGTGAVLLASVAAPLFVGIGYGIARYFNKSCGRDFVELINEMTDGYYQTSLDGELILANPAFSRLMGYENQDQLKAGAGAEVTKLDVGGHGTGIGEIRLTELAWFFATACHEELLVVSG